MDWIIGAVCALIVAGAAYAKKSLTLSGCLAAVIMGTIYYGAGNLFWFGTLLLFSLPQRCSPNFARIASRSLRNRMRRRAIVMRDRSWLTVESACFLCWGTRFSHTRHGCMLLSVSWLPLLQIHGQPSGEVSAVSRRALL